MTFRPKSVSDSEIEIRLQCEREDFAAAARAILHCFGDEVRAFVFHRTHNAVAVEEVFSAFSEDLWKGLPGLRFHGKVRSWVFAVARNALWRHIKSRQRWGRRHVVTEPDELPVEMRRSMDARIVERVCLSPLLSELQPEDRRLLEQRLVRSMSWRDIAAERDTPGRPLPEAALLRESARLRKRFQHVLERLRAHSLRPRSQPGPHGTHPKPRARKTVPSDARCSFPPECPLSTTHMQETNMKTETRSTQLVAIDEISLENVAGGQVDVDVSIDIDATLSIVKQKNKLVFSYNEINADGDFAFAVEQSNSNG